MKKLFVMLSLLGVFALIILGGGVVMADDPPVVETDLTVIINEDIEILISPSVLDFGPLEPGTFDNVAINGPIVIDPSGSNVDVNVIVSDVTGNSLFMDNLDLNGGDPLLIDEDFVCVGDPCTYTPIDIIATLDVPSGTPAGTKLGAITYMVSGPTP